MLNKLLEKLKDSNLKRGLFRLFLIATISVFCAGAYYDFSPTAWLYGSVDYDDVVEKTTANLKDESCRKGALMYMHPVDNPKDLSYFVLEKRSNGTLMPIQDCNGLALYGETLGKERIGNGIDVSSLTESSVRSEIEKIKSERRLEMIQDRVLNGAKDVLNFWGAVLAVVVVVSALSWIARGFKH